MATISSTVGSFLNRFLIGSTETLIINEYESYTIAEDLILDGELYLTGVLGVL